MQFHLGAVPDSKDFSPGEDWKPLREPGPILIQVFALPVALLSCAVLSLLWVYLTPVAKHPAVHPFLLIAVILLIIPVHELLHASTFPRFGAEKTILGLWPSRILFYAHFSGELSRSRFIAALCMPFLVLSVVPLLICTVIGSASLTIAFISLFNSLVAGIDIFGVLLLLFQVPKGAVVRNQGWRTYWRRAATN